MAPRSSSAGPASSVEVVTITLLSSSSSATSGVQISGNNTPSSSIPIGQIVGGFVGGVTIALVLVLIWKYWGRVIKRTERRRLKEAQAILTVRENTRRNASSGFNPQSEYRPMFTLKPDSRRVTFLARTPTPSKEQTDAFLTESASPVVDESMRVNSPSAAVLAVEEIPSTSSSAALPLLVTHERSENDQPREEHVKSVGYRRPPSPTPTPLRTRANIPPRDQGTQQALPSSPPPPPPPPKYSPSPEHGILHGTRTPSPTPAILPLKPRPRPSLQPRSSSLDPLQASTSTSEPTPSSSRAALPLVIPPVPVITTTTASPLPSPTSSSSSPLSSPASSLSSPSQFPLPPAAASAWIRSPLRNSVLPSSADRPVIMPRAKNATVPVPPPPPPALEFLATEPVSLRPSVPSTGSTASQYSTASGEPRVRRSFFDSFGRRHKSVVATIASSKRRTSTLSSVSVYSNNDD